MDYWTLPHQHWCGVLAHGHTPDVATQGSHQTTHCLGLESVDHIAIKGANAMVPSKVCVCPAGL